MLTIIRTKKLKELENVKFANETAAIIQFCFKHELAFNSWSDKWNIYRVTITVTYDSQQFKIKSVKQLEALIKLSNLIKEVE